MYNDQIKIAISGKANSGKNTVSKFLIDGISERVGDEFKGGKIIALADPIKEMARIMFPNVPRKHFFGPSKYRSSVIPNSYKNEKPLTVRQVLIDIGTGLGRGYRDSMWLDNFDYRFEKYKNTAVIIVPDVRFRNEFDHLKNKNFYSIRLKRDSHLEIDDISETNQDSIEDLEFDCLLHNNSTLDKLRKDVDKILDIIVK